MLLLYVYCHSVGAYWLSGLFSVLNKNFPTVATFSPSDRCKLFIYVIMCNVKTIKARLCSSSALNGVIFVLKLILLLFSFLFFPCRHSSQSLSVFNNFKSQSNNGGRSLLLIKKKKHIKLSAITKQSFRITLVKVQCRKMMFLCSECLQF